MPSFDSPFHITDPEETQRRGRLVLHTLPVLLIPIGVTLITIVILAIFGGLPEPPEGVALRSPLVPILALVIFCSALIVLVRLRRPGLSAIVLIGTWTLFTMLGMLRGGVTAIPMALMIVPICVAGLLIDGAASVSLAALATLLVIVLAYLEQQGLAPVGLNQLPFEGSVSLAAGYWIGLFWTIAALTSLLAGGTQRALRESRARAEELRRLSAELEARVQAQTAELLTQAQERATLEERTRLAREIHDTLAQGLTGVVVQIGAARHAQQAHKSTLASAEAVSESLTLAERLARETLAEARRSVWNLRTTLLERGDLGDALAQVAAQGTLPGVRVQFEQIGEAVRLESGVESALLRVAQEALANVAKHAAATQVQMRLRYMPNEVRLTISDNGRGLPIDVIEHPVGGNVWGGFGILGMRERIAALGGRLELRNADGAEVVASVPI